MLHSKSRRNLYMDFLKRHGIRKNNHDSDDDENETSQLTLRFMPLPVATRWCSWFEMAFYVYKYLDYIRRFYEEEQQVETSEVVNNIVAIFTSSNENRLVEVYLAFIYQYAPQFISAIKFFQKESDPVFPFIEERIVQLEVFLNNGK